MADKEKAKSHVSLGGNYSLCNKQHEVGRKQEHRLESFLKWGENILNTFSQYIKVWLRQDHNDVESYKFMRVASLTDLCAICNPLRKSVEKRRTNNFCIYCFSLQAQRGIYYSPT
jgi:hypothetical protein